MNELTLLRQGPESFTIRYRNRSILSHSPHLPALVLAEGSSEYTASHGMFRIRNTAHSYLDTRDAVIVCEKPELISISFGSVIVLHISIRKGEGVGADCVEFRFHSSDPRANRLMLRLPAARKERIYGCGEQYSVQNLRGRRFPIWTQEQGIGRGHDLITFLASLTHGGAGGNWATTYWAQPTFVSSEKWFLHADTESWGVFDFSRRDRHELAWNQIPGLVTIGVAESMPECLSGLSSILGKQPALPDWAMSGVLLGVQGGTEVIRKKLDDARKAGTAVSALWVQDWEGRKITSFGKQLQWNWQFDPDLYPELPSDIARWKNEGIRFLGYINCFLVTDREQYAEALARGYLIKNGDGGAYHSTITTFPAGTLDLTNPDCRTWIKGIIKKNMIDIGQAGWMADFGEHCPTDGVFHSGETGEIVHNRYPALWAQVNREALEESKILDDSIFFSRSGYTGTAKESPLLWAGDQLVNWSRDDGLASVIPAGVSAGLTGVGYHHSDIGGYTTVAWIKRSKEVFLRWTEQAAFTPVMRTHEGNRPESNWQFNSDDETLRHFARMSRIHSSLLPYLKAASGEYQKTGLPLMRHPLLHYEDDETCADLVYQYLLGRDLMVAPVVRKGAQSVRCYLPKDEWIHLWTGKQAKPGWQSVYAPIGYPPVFYREHSPYAPLFNSLRTDEDSRTSRGTER